MPPSSSLRALTSLGLRIALGSLLLPLVVAPRDQHSFVNGAKGSCLQRIACDNDGQLRKYRNSLESILDNTWGEQTGWGAVIAGGGTNAAHGDGAFVGGGGAINKDDMDADFYTEGNNAKGLLSAVIAGSGNVAEGNCSFVGVGHMNKAGTNETHYSVVVGGEFNEASGYGAFVGTGYGSVASGTHSYVGTGYWTNATGDGAFANGYGNYASGRNSFVGNGNTDGTIFSGNNASGDMSFVGNGINNFASGRMGTIINGQDNSASANGAFVGTGMSNRASGEFGSIVSGKNNMASGSYSVVGTGTFNVASGFNSFIASGQSEGSGIVNEASGDGAFIGSGEGNRASGRNAFVSSGYQINATGELSHAIGGQFSSASGPRSMSMGSYAYAEHENSTVLNAGAKKCASDDVNQFKICSNTKVAAKFYADEYYMKTPLLSEGYANLNVLLYFLTALCFIQSCAIIGIILVINRREKKVMNQETGELEVKKMPILPCFGGRDSSVQPGKKVKKYKINPRGQF